GLAQPKSVAANGARAVSCTRRAIAQECAGCRCRPTADKGADHGRGGQRQKTGLSESIHDGGSTSKREPQTCPSLSFTAVPAGTPTADYASERTTKLAGLSSCRVPSGASAGSDMGRLLAWRPFNSHVCTTPYALMSMLPCGSR